MLLIVGASGQLGKALVKLLPNAIAANSKQLDITDFDTVNAFVTSYKVTVIVNCAAYTKVDQAEIEKDLAYQVNYIGALNLAQTGAKIIHISTDYVFDGAKALPYIELDQPNPQSVYGETKLLGERAVLEFAKSAIVIRTSWLYSLAGSNFVTTMLSLGKNKSHIKVVADQFGTPTCVDDLAIAIVKILPSFQFSQQDIYHFANDGVCSWYEFAVAIMNYAKLDCEVLPITTDQYPTKAKRPQYSALDSTKIQTKFKLIPSSWSCVLQKQLQQSLVID